MKHSVVYIHGKGGSADESERFKPLFPGHEVIGLDYKTFTPWETGKELHAAFERLQADNDSVVLIANSIGAFFSMNAGLERWLERAFFISPIVDMERLITDMMLQAQVSEEELERLGVIQTPFGEELSWEYLRYVREHPVKWDCPTDILYGGQDALTSRETVERFARLRNARLTVLENAGHWFHTEEELRFLDAWIVSNLGK